MKVLSEHGQLSLPIMAVLFLFGTAISLHARQSLFTYRKMKLDIAADLTALSAARSHAQQLNTLASFQTELLPILPKVSFGSTNVGAMNPKALKTYYDIHKKMDAAMRKFFTDIQSVASIVAHANGALVAVPRTPKHMQPRLNGETVYVWIPPKPAIVRLRNAYYTRQWKTNSLRAQPDHKHIWWVYDREGNWAAGRAQLWLDQSAGSLSNGGFPPPNPSFWAGMGILSLLPHFNARLMPRKANE